MGSPFEDELSLSESRSADEEEALLARKLGLVIEAVVKEPCPREAFERLLWSPLVFFLTVAVGVDLMRLTSNDWGVTSTPFRYTRVECLEPLPDGPPLTFATLAFTRRLDCDMEGLNSRDRPGTSRLLLWSCLVLLSMLIRALDGEAML